jgi:hypothetical protein
VWVGVGGWVGGGGGGGGGAGPTQLCLVPKVFRVALPGSASAS